MATWRAHSASTASCGSRCSPEPPASRRRRFRDSAPGRRRCLGTGSYRPGAPFRGCPCLACSQIRSRRAWCSLSCSLLLCCCCCLSAQDRSLAVMYVVVQPMQTLSHSLPAVIAVPSSSPRKRREENKGDASKPEKSVSVDKVETQKEVGPHHSANSSCQPNCVPSVSCLLSFPLQHPHTHPPHHEPNHVPSRKLGS